MRGESGIYLELSTFQEPDCVTSGDGEQEKEEEDAEDEDKIQETQSQVGQSDLTWGVNLSCRRVMLWLRGRSIQGEGGQDQGGQ